MTHKTFAYLLAAALILPPQEPAGDQKEYAPVSDDLVNRIIEVAVRTYSPEKKIEQLDIVDNLIRLYSSSSAESQDDDDTGSFLWAYQHNIDANPDKELFVFYGKRWSSWTLVLIKRIKNEWRIIFGDEVYTKYQDPEVLMLEGESPNKVFYIPQLYGSGTGVYDRRYLLFRLSGDGVKPVQEIIEEAYIDGWDLFMNQKVSTSLQMLPGDVLEVTYRYSFYPHFSFETDTRTFTHPGGHFLQDSIYARYSFNPESVRFELLPDQNDESVAEKISCFGAFGKDSLIVRAFETEFEELLVNGEEWQRNMLTYYIDMARKQGTVRLPK